MDEERERERERRKETEKRGRAWIDQESQISAIFAELNLPGISKTALKAREREIGPSIERVAEISCTTAIQQEMKLLQAVNNIPTWCTSLRDENYRQAHILQGTELRKDFQNVIHGYTNESMLEILAHVQSTNANENMNHMVARKAPKTVTYSESESLDFRVSAAVLYQHCKEVTSVAASEALLAFKRWLEAFGSHILLVAHNVMFDARLLVAKYQEEGITVPKTIGFADSLRLFRTVYPGRQNYRLASLVHDIAGVDFGAHDVSEDVYALSSILQLQTNLDKLSNCATTVSSVKFKLQELNNEKIYKGSYTTFVESKIISKAQATRLSRSGISIEHLKKVYSRSGLDGMQAVLKDRGAGKFYTKVASALDAVFSENKINLN
ncbi:uncharacterized protein LOC128244478 [Mya arenaria]|uniref:uncharacterized protein LOC128244478 n=1 Tax=Mya arenaria TaxID=6604 RepID=UPI0022DEC911|nr:uncharacterized protein LOC128244478 [Mya arenaria]